MGEKQTESEEERREIMYKKNKNWKIVFYDFPQKMNTILKAKFILINYSLLFIFGRLIKLRY